MSEHPGDVTRLLADIGRRESGAEARLADLIYAELRKLAASHMRFERPDHTLSPTALANEAWARFGSDLPERDLDSRQAFFAVAATAMRRILVEHARTRHAQKRGGHAQPVKVDWLDSLAAPPTTT
jgi:RNA polymerase sigma factor (TIGR02999 family)